MLGTLSEFTLADLLQLFAVSEKSGAILVHAGNKHTRLLIESDKVIGLGAVDFDPLVDALRIELVPGRLRNALLGLEPRDDTPGLSLLVENHIDPQRWNQYVARRFEQDVYPLLNEVDGAFEITVERCAAAPLKVSATVQQLILDGSRWEAESEALRAEGYCLDGAWQRSADQSPTSTVGIDHSGWLVWIALRSKASIAEAALRIGIPDLVATTMTKQLHGLGLIERAT